MKAILRLLKPFGPLAEPRDLRYYLGAGFCGLCLVAALFWLWGCSPLPTAPAPSGCYVLTDTLAGVSQSNLAYYHHVNDSLVCPQGLLP